MYCDHKDKYTWWEFDARGIPLCLVCEDCRTEKLQTYQSDILTNFNYRTDEPIEED